ERGLGGGLSNLELGLRMRYEIHRKVAPYVGFVWERSFGETADFRRLAGENPTEHRFVAGLRIWW
ncbi:copper resistance protein B, partial [Acinetobacter baumannii]